MTYKETLELIFPRSYVRQIMNFYCPKDVPDKCSPLECENCWNREMPEPSKEEDHD